MERFRPFVVVDTTVRAGTGKRDSPVIYAPSIQNAMVTWALLRNAKPS